MADLSSVSTEQRGPTHLVELKGHSKSDHPRGPEGIISIMPARSRGTIVTVHRTWFVLLLAISLFITFG